MSVYKEPDAPLHGECAHEIHRLQAELAQVTRERDRYCEALSDVLGWHADATEGPAAPREAVLAAFDNAANGARRALAAGEGEK